MQNIFKYYMPQQKVLQKVMEKFFIRTSIFTQFKTTRTLKLDVFKILDNKYIKKLYSKYELLFLD